MNKQELIDTLESRKDGVDRDFHKGYDLAMTHAIEVIKQFLDGHAIVPVEPIIKQVFAGEAEFKTGRYSRDEMVNAYQAMINSFNINKLKARKKNGK